MTARATQPVRRSSRLHHMVCRVSVFTVILLSGCATALDRTADEQGMPDVAKAAQNDQAHARLIELGRQALQARNYRDAFTNFSRAVDLKSDDGEALIGLAESYLGARNLPKAVETFEKAHRVEPVRALALQGHGLALALMGQREASHARLLAAVEQNPSLWRAWNALGRSHDLAGAWPHAELAYAEALRLNPKAAEIHSNRGVSMLLRMRYAEAAEAFEAAIDLEPGLQEARDNHRLALAFAGRYAEAIAGVPPGQREKVLNNVGYVALQQRDFVAAEKYLRDAMNTSATYYAKAAENLEELRVQRNLSAAQPQSARVMAAVGLPAPAPRPLPRDPVVASNEPDPAMARETAMKTGPISIIPISAESPAKSADEATPAFATSAGTPARPAPNPNTERTTQRTFRIQLGAARSEADARAEWPRLQKAHQSLLGHLVLTVERAETAAKDVFYRIQAGPFTERAAIESACRELLKRHVPCQPVRSVEP